MTDKGRTLSHRAKEFSNNARTVVTGPGGGGTGLLYDIYKRQFYE